jgi:hypothetical protein
MVHLLWGLVKSPELLEDLGTKSPRKQLVTFDSSQKGRRKNMALKIGCKKKKHAVFYLIYFVADVPLQK